MSFGDQRTNYTLKENHLTAVKAIRAKCMDCCGEQYGEVTKCPCKDCALYPYRMGKKPVFDTQGVLIDDQVAARRVTSKAWEEKNKQGATGAENETLS